MEVENPPRAGVASEHDDREGEGNAAAIEMENAAAIEMENAAAAVEKGNSAAVASSSSSSAMMWFCVSLLFVSVIVLIVCLVVLLNPTGSSDDVDTYTTEMPLLFNWSFPYDLPEGMEFDISRNYVILSSAAFGRIVGFNASQVVGGTDYDMSEAHIYAQGNNQVYATLGLRLDPNQNCYLYACVGDIGHTRNSTGIAYYDICNDQFLFYNNFYPYGVTNTVNISQANDLVIDKETNIAYITDSYGWIVWSLPDPNISTSVPTILKANVCDTPNGIEYLGQYLLIGCIDGLYRLDVRTLEIQKVQDPSNTFIVLDGLRFNAERTILYGVLDGIRANIPWDEVIAVTSTDCWATLLVIEDYTVNCPKGYPSSVKILDSIFYASCTDKFGMGPYAVHIGTSAITNALPNCE